MSEQADKGGSTIVDSAKLVLAIAVLIAGIAGYYWFAGMPVAVRILMVLAGLGIGAALLFWSAQGQVLWQYIQGSRVELRKMVWPTRQETLQTTLVVFVAILAMGIFFWVLDWVLGALTAALTQKGG